ncbi:MAG TPA: carboxypeptidase-like regulatory domain-containing protein, partial [Verrucomicrobiota bacterium]|nr:hypothetical protein [Verrucomicrobiales bacterium]HRI12954.1 carboxypeptidase-like regulatory domain-containing protein [Verrucomicrobiota bacterium]
MPFAWLTEGELEGRQELGPDDFVSPTMTINPRLRAFALGMAFFGAALANARAQDTLVVSDFRLDDSGRPVVRIPYAADSYYVLRRGEELSLIRSPVALVAQAMAGDLTQTELTDDGLPILAVAQFYRVTRILRAAPQDTDEDGMDDVYELERGPLLDPLDAADGVGDPDGDRRLTKDEYLAGTDPFRYDAPEAPVLTTLPDATMQTLLELRGTSAAGTYVRVDGGAALATNDVSADGAFSVLVRLATNRVNRLFVSSVDAQGVASIGKPVEVLQDSQPPKLFLDFPTNFSRVTDAQTMIAGRVGDSLSGYRGLNVWVHSSPSEGEPPLSSVQFSENSPLRGHVDVGIGPNGTYQRGEVPLALGTNIITVIAGDLLGNRTTRRSEIVRLPLEGPRLIVVSGDRQTTNAWRRVAEPIVVRATQADGAPLVGTELTFDVTRSDGRLLPFDTNQLSADWTLEPNSGTNGAMKLVLRTDASGEAKVWWTLGSDAGNANNRVCVMNSGISNAVFFCASATAHPARQINIGSGNNQKIETGGEIAEPLRVWVSDGLNAVPGTPVTFRIVQGGGRLIPGGRDGSVISQFPDSLHSTQMVIATGLTGHAAVGFVAGLDAGQNLIEASFPNQFGLPTTFIVYGVGRDPDQPGDFTGLVLDNTSNPVGNAYCRLTVGNYELGTFSDGQGRFRFDNVPGGMGHLYVDGRTANLLYTNAIPTNSFPTLSYPVVAIANAQNSLPTPVLLPRKRLTNEVVYYGTNDLVVTCPDIEGLKMTIKANSMRHADGNPVTPLNPAWVSLNQVHHDNIPMPMPDGASPAFAWTLQPGGATFDPNNPVAIEYPNMSGLPPGSIAYFLSFNHDTERFEIVSSGHVTNDGASILTDPGSGLTLAGWGCNCPPYSVSGRIESCCKIEGPKVIFSGKLLPNKPITYSVNRVPSEGKIEWSLSKGSDIAGILWSSPKTATLLLREPDEKFGEVTIRAKFREGEKDCISTLTVLVARIDLRARATFPEPRRRTRFGVG